MAKKNNQMLMIGGLIAVGYFLYTKSAAASQGGQSGGQGGQGQYSYTYGGGSSGGSQGGLQQSAYTYYT